LAKGRTPVLPENTAKSRNPESFAVPSNERRLTKKSSVKNPESREMAGFQSDLKVSLLPISAPH
jgi:hypothetical protein